MASRCSVTDDGAVKSLSGSFAVPGGEPDPAHAERLQRMLVAGFERVAQWAPVVGLASPALAGRVGEWHTSGAARSLTLCYGSPTHAAGPYIEVRTDLGEHPPMEPLSEVLADERDRLFDHAGVDEPDPVEALSGHMTLPIDDTRQRARLRHEDNLWAVRTNLPNQTGDASRQAPAVVTVIGRGVAENEVTLTRVSDLYPFVEAAKVRLHAQMAAERARPRPVPQPPSGIEAHQQLIEHLLADAREPRRRHPRRPPDEYGRLWESAVLGQMHLARQSRQHANDEVSLMVNQIIQLADNAPWWEEDSAAAIAEIIRYTIFDSDVPSKTAQQAWRASFTAQRPPSPPDAAGFEQYVTARQRAEKAWLEAWDAWHAQGHDPTPNRPDLAT